MPCTGINGVDCVRERLLRPLFRTPFREIEKRDGRMENPVRRRLPVFSVISTLALFSFVETRLG